MAGVGDEVEDGAGVGEDGAGMYVGVQVGVGVLVGGDMEVGVGGVGVFGFTTAISSGERLTVTTGEMQLQGVQLSHR